jgi:hypothetical protein
MLYGECISIFFLCFFFEETLQFKLTTGHYRYMILIGSCSIDRSDEDNNFIMFEINVSIYNCMTSNFLSKSSKEQSFLFFVKGFTVERVSIVSTIFENNS